MIKLFFTFALLFSFAAASASSNWIVIDESKEVVFAIETYTIQKNSESITFWARRNYNKRQKDGSLSAKEQITINCRTRDRIFRFIQTFDGNNNSGEIVNTIDRGGSWQPIPPDSIMMSYYEFVCKK
jgi:hypothetical protein